MFLVQSSKETFTKNLHHTVSQVGSESVIASLFCGHSVNTRGGGGVQILNTSANCLNASITMFLPKLNTVNFLGKNGNKFLTLRWPLVEGPFWPL